MVGFWSFPPSAHCSEAVKKIKNGWFWSFSWCISSMFIHEYWLADAKYQYQGTINDRISNSGRVFSCRQCGSAEHQKMSFAVFRIHLKALISRIVSILGSEQWNPVLLTFYTVCISNCMLYYHFRIVLQQDCCNIIWLGCIAPIKPL